MQNTLGIDLGTSSVKVILIDENQRTLASASVALTIQRPHDGWSEQDPDAWCLAVARGIEAIRAAAPAALSTIRAIGLSGHMHGATLLDKADKPLRPAILWNDTRAHREASELDAVAQFRQLTGNIVFPGFTAPKLLWCRRHEAHTCEKLKTVVLPKDYVRLWLTGEKITDRSDASGTSWLNVGTRDWSDNLLHHCGLNRDFMPTLVEGNEPGGMLRSGHAKQWGINGPVVVAGGAGDNAATACGLGVTTPGTAFISLGTSGVLFAPASQFKAAPETAVHSFCHALPRTWHQMGVILAATDSLNWYASLVGQDITTLIAELQGDASPSEGLCFLPYLSGERTPHNDSRAMGAFIGLSQRHDRKAMTRAVLTGVSCAMADCLAAIEATGTSISHVTAVGGGARADIWLQMLATVLRVPVSRAHGSDTSAALGAARLGMSAISKSHAADLFVSPKIDQTFEPDQQHDSGFKNACQQYRKLYPALSAVMLKA